MTWYANEVLALASPAVVRAIMHDDLLASFAYQLMPPLEYAWHTPQVAHGLPPTGLVVIRPVCDATPDEAPADWYGEPVRDWLLFSSPADPSVLDLRARVAEFCSLPLETLPPTGLLSHLKRLAHQTQSPFIFYGCAMWGGDIESECAFVFSHADLAIVSLQPAAPGERRPVSILECDTHNRVVQGDALVLALGYLGLELPSPFFAPHTRSFPWSRYKLRGEPA